MKTCGLLGRKLGHSYSPAIHSLLADYSYKLYEVEPEDLEQFVKTAPYHGLNVTIPYKKDVIPFCDLLDPLAQELGSVNTLVRLADGRLMGANTDAWGFDQMLGRVGADVKGKKVLVLGSGGASATVQAILRRAEATVVVISRAGENNYENLDRHRDAAVLVNTTPVGMYPNNGLSPVSLEVFPHLEAVLDLIYNPARTKLCMDAEERGIPWESGLYMLTAQAALASQYWTEAEISGEQLDAVWRKIGTSMENIVLIGMPGSGKTTVGKKLAEALNRPLLDADAELVDRIGDIPAFFAAHGEEAFRQAETQVLEDLGKRSGLVLATGGGCVTRKENYRLLHQNGKIVWLQRQLDRLPVAGRPVSQRDGVAAIYEKRKPLYLQFSDIHVDNNGTADDAVNQIINSLGGCL